MREIDQIETAAAILRDECVRLLDDSRLLGLLAGYGTPHVTGSFLLDLMVWRDLDIELVAEDLAVERFFELGRELAARLAPARMSFRNERIMRTAGLPCGLYWGVYQSSPDGWKIDIWAIDQAEQDRRRPYVDWVRDRLTPESRRTILGIKSAVWNNPGYRQAYSSKDVYDAVLGAGVNDMAAFSDYLAAKGVVLK